MFILPYIYFLATVCLAIIARVCYLVFVKHGKQPEERDRTNPAKTMIILGSGGHTAEMMRILRHLSFKNYSPRIYIHARTDKMSVEKAKELEGNNTDYKIIEIYRSREVRQSYLTSIFTTLRAFLDSVPLLWRERPELILCNGPGTCVPLCIVSFLFKVFFITNTTVIFVESFCRVKTLSLTGKILYYFADYVIVQWPSLSKPAVMCEEPSVFRLIPWESLLGDLQNCIPIEIKVHLAAIVDTLKDFDQKKLDHSEKWIENSLTLTDACLDRTWEALNSGYWKDVPIEYRYCYTLCTVIKTVLLELRYESNTLESGNDKITVLRSIVQQVDKGILLGAPLPNVPSLLTKIASTINEYCSSKTVEKSIPRELITGNDSICDEILPGFSQINSYEEPSMESFYRDIFMPKIPAILKGCIKHWKALERWQNLEYLNRVAGSRTVPIEIGSRYTEEDWTQHLINFSEFIQKHVSAKTDKVGYLAQHQLFEQIPELKDDFAVPEYCNFSDNDEPEPPDVNAWFGPGGTVSPLHFDPKNNLLCQVFGYKRVILYHPNDTANLYPYESRLLNNTAQVDPMTADYEKWPNLIKAKGIMCYLKPGEMLYIPPKWWHHVTALTPSFSISFWWN